MRLASMLIGAVAIGVTSTAPTLSRATSLQHGERLSCVATEHRQFDFWAGDWNAFEVNDRATVVARARVDIILEGCVLHEVYEGANGLTGQSFSIYDASRGVWHQSWVTNRGHVLVLEGGMEGDRMVLAGTQRAPDGRAEQLRGEWRRADGGVRETARTSPDGGKTWRPLFDLVFRAHAR